MNSDPSSRSCLARCGRLRDCCGDGRRGFGISADGIEPGGFPQRKFKEGCWALFSDLDQM